MYKNHCRDYKIEMDYLRHAPAKRIYGGRIDKIGMECQEALLTVPVRSLAEIEPFRYYDVVMRRHVPECVKGLLLKVKILGHIALEPKDYIGYGERNTYHEMHREEHDRDHEHDEEVEIIEERVPAEVFDATMFGFGNAAMVDDILCFDNSPYPFIRFYVNDEGKFVIMPCQEFCCERPKRLVVRRTEVIREPFKAHTLAIKRTATPYVHPQRRESFEKWTQGNFECCEGGY